MWPGATTLAPRKEWKYSVPPSERRRVEHCGQPILREQKCSVPSSAISSRPPRRWNADRPSAAAMVSSALRNSPSKAAGRIAVEHLADVVVARNRRHAEQGLAVRPAVPLRQRPLVPQERRALHEEHRERRQADVRHGVAVARPLALVLKPGTDLFQFRQQFLQCAHAAVESHFTRPRKAPFMTPSQFNAPPAPSRDANATQPH